ncbi:MAG TPA: glycosyltransferase family 39 protein [Thermoanaerobaculia bacterium]|jgi:4-amino-4-deoxy-L-arabinose transferase-like glycosyltransferase
MSRSSFTLSRRGSSLLAALLLVAFLAQGALGIRHKSMTWDEDTHLSYGRQILTQHTFARQIHRYNATSPWVVVNALPGLAARRLGIELPPRRALYAGRISTLLLGALLGWLVFSWAREAFGPPSGLLAVTLLTFCPNLLAHSALITTDAVTTLAIFAAAYAFWRLYAQPSRARLWVAGVVLGLALTVKLSGVYLVPIFLLVLLLRGLASRRFDLKPFLSLLLLLAVALLVINAVYLFEGTFSPLSRYQPRSLRFQALASAPVLRDLPLPLPTGYVQGIDWVTQDMARGRWVYCLGRYSHNGFPYYYAVALLTKGTVGFLALIALALACLALRAPRRSWEVQIFLLVPVAFYFIYFSLFFKFQIGLRHLLPIFPFLFVFVSQLATLQRRSLRALAWLLAVAHAASSLRVHPHYLAYFNEAVGGPLQGWRYLIDSNLDWGQDRDAARHVYAPSSPVPVVIDPGGPTAGRVMVSATALVGLIPEAHKRYAWLRENFLPVDHVGYSWLVYDVSVEALRRCCAELFRELPDKDGDLALEGRPIGGGDGIEVRGLEHLNDGELGSDSRLDPAYTFPLTPRPVSAWFGIDWGSEPRIIDRVVAYPRLHSRHNQARAFIAAEYVVQVWQDGAWVDVPGTRTAYNGEPRIEQRFPPVSTSKVRLWVLATRNDRGRVRSSERFRTACLELAAFGPDPHSSEGTGRRPGRPP